MATMEVWSGLPNPRLQKWLKSIDLSSTGNGNVATGYEAVRSLIFPSFSVNPYILLPAIALNNDIELMRRCRELRKVQIHWFRGAMDNADGTVKSIDKLRRTYRLDGMLELEKLETLTMTGYGLHRGALEELKKWFEDEFVQRGRKTSVVLA